MMAWFDEAAQTAYDDLTAGEQCIAVDGEKGVYVLTKHKRKLCRGPPSKPFKSAADASDFIAALAPNAPLQSVSWHGHSPPAVNPYNVLLTGTAHAKAVSAALPPEVGHVGSTSNDEIYAAFLSRKNQSLALEAEDLIDKMLADVARGQQGACYFASSMKELGCARRNALLKRCYVASDKKKFIQSAREEGDVGELFVIEPRKDGAGKFEEYGGVVFETFYKLDLSIYG
jgi:hypothetical protein